MTTKFKGFVFGSAIPDGPGFYFGIGGPAAFNPLDLDPVAFYDPSDASTLFQDTSGTTPAGVGDPVGLVLDKSGNENHVTAPSGAARPVYAVSESGDKLLQSDEVDDELSVTLPDLGADVTIAYTTQSELRIDEGETVSAGEYTLPQVDLLNYLMIDRQLTKSEKIELIRYLSRSAEGVNYGAVIDDMILTCLNAVDVFVYDTSKDSDGGAWRKRTQGTSWYNETLNTSTRGSRREFPSVAVIVAESNKVIIYDGDDPSLPMWRVEDYTGLTLRSVVAGIGQIWIAVSTGVVLSDYAGDSLGTTTPNYTTATSPAIVNNSASDIAMTVLPDAPIDPATGLPVPTIAVATAGGVSVIKDDGTVVDSAATTASAVAIDEEKLSYVRVDECRVISLDNIVSDGFTYDRRYNTGPTYSASFLPQPLSGSNKPLIADDVSFAASLGLTRLYENTSSQTKGMVAYTTSTYNTGWMNGDIKGAFLSDTDDTDLVGGTDADRSVNGNDLTVNGTITRTPVATGADLVAYSGFSTSNYLEGTDASYVDTLYAIGWEQTSGVWGFKHGVVSAAPIDGLTITTNALKIEGTKPKALLRISATAPTAEQIAKIYNDEKVLFQENAAATLYGTSDAVTALAHDPDTDLLHVGTSDGRSVFRGLERIQNTTTSVSKVISASGGLVAEK